MIHVSENEFQQFMEQAMESIPDIFKGKMDNIAFIVEEYPNSSDLSRLGMTDGRHLLGLYSGIPFTHRNSWYAGTTPDRIILFQRNIEAICSSTEELASKVREVVVHEIAHYFGMTDKEIREAGY